MHSKKLSEDGGAESEPRKLVEVYEREKERENETWGKVFRRHGWLQDIFGVLAFTTATLSFQIPLLGVQRLWGTDPRRGRGLKKVVRVCGPKHNRCARHSRGARSLFCLGLL